MFIFIKRKKEEILNLPGIDERFDIPAKADLVLNPEKPSENLTQLITFLGTEGIFPLNA